MESIPSVAALEAVHTFPGDYTFKIFGENSPAFPAVIREVAKHVLAKPSSIRHRQRASAKGNHLCVTLVVTAQSAEEVRALYRALMDTASVRTLM